MNLHFELELDPSEKTHVHETLKASGSGTELAAGCVRLISLIYSRTARHSKAAAEQFRQACLVALLHPDSPAFNVSPCDVASDLDISAVIPKRRKE